MKLKSLIKYQCWTTLKPLLIFYAIMYSIITVGYILTYAAIGSVLDAPFNGIETSCLIFIGIMGSLGFGEDFKMAIQNGFTRKQILAGTLIMFVFTTCLMSIIDTLAAHIMLAVSPNYTSLFQQIYGHGHFILIEWFGLFLLYFLVALVCYLLTLVCNKIGKKLFYFILISVGLLFFIILPILMSLYLPQDLMSQIGKGLATIIGYSANGTIHFINPLLLFTTILAVVTGFSYLTIKKTELN